VLVRRLLLLVIGVTALAACGSPTVQAPEATPPEAAVSTPSAVPAALAFSANRVGGGTMDLGDYAGKPVLLWFWAPT
jgi:hypothetical protein